MELGKRLKQARLETGLSQRQLCGDEITRNMLSLIENGSARPSMDTLRYLAGRLGKPMSYFLEEPTVASPNQALMEQARSATPAEAIVLLKSYQAPDPVFDRERWLLEALACLSAAEQALSDGRAVYAASLLEQAAQAGKCTPYYTPELERLRLLLCHRAKLTSAQELVTLLPDHTEELMLRAEAALATGEPARCGRLLDAVENRQTDWYFLRAEAYFAAKDYVAATEHYQKAGERPQIFARLEECYRELEDYKMAYFYACKQK